MGLTDSEVQRIRDFAATYYGTDPIGQAIERLADALTEARTRVLSVRDYEMCPNSFDRDCCCETIWRLLGLGNGEDVLLWP